MKWGILATGTIARKFADTVNHMDPEAEKLIACASRNLEHGKAFAEKYGIPKVYGSYGEMMTDSEVEAVISLLLIIFTMKTAVCVWKQGNMFFAKSHLPLVQSRPRNCLIWQKKRACLLWKLSGSVFYLPTISFVPCFGMV